MCDHYQKKTILLTENTRKRKRCEKSTVFDSPEMKKVKAALENILLA